MSKEKKLNNSSSNILKRNNLDFDENEKSQTEKNLDNNLINSEQWALKVNFSIKNENEEKNEIQNRKENQNGTENKLVNIKKKNR